MKRSLIIGLHAGFWLCYCLLILLMLGVFFQNNAEEQRVNYYFGLIFRMAVVPSVIGFYLFYFLVFSTYVRTRKLWIAIGYALLGSILAASVGYVGVASRYGTACLSKTGSALGGFLLITFVAFVSGVVALVIQGFITWFSEIKLKEALAQKNHEMELALIKSQLDPHFLFNTINNIDVLILKNAAAASSYLNQLSDIMRFMLYETKTNVIPLTKEVEYIEKYIALQKIRTTNQGYISFLVEGSLGGKTIAPMVLIPFIENAFKHTGNKKLENAISVSICSREKSIEFSCKNRINPNKTSLSNANGLGNELIRKRLNLLYPERHTLAISQQGNLYQVQLTITNP
ncbi:sensor histidine kinase [Spirosoma sp. SC4-14]|uniref:sensor histidine kinase n=1 Tax=Spirosoma sp. SC4-14 TaxID=3128900 RepID=UPI0030D4AC08